MRVTVIATGFEQRPVAEAEEAKADAAGKPVDNTDIEDIFKIFNR